MGNYLEPSGRAMIICGIPNLVETAARVIAVGGSESSDLPAENIGTAEPSELSRVTINDPLHTAWSIELRDFDDDTSERVERPYDIDFVALVNHNLHPGAQVRFVAPGAMIGLTGVDADYHDFIRHERLAPSAIEASTNATGAVTNVDESPASPDGAVIEATSTGSWTARLSFPTPTSSPSTGADKQSFVLFVKASGGIPSDQAESVRVDLYEGGSQVGTLGTKYLTEATGQYMVFPWDADDLGDASGADVEARVIASNRVELDAVAWDVDRGAGANESSSYDSGWLDVPAYTPTYDTGQNEAPYYLHPEPTRSLHHVIDGNEGGILGGGSAYVALFVAVRSARTAPSLVRSPGFTVDPYTQIGVACAGPALTLSHGITHQDRYAVSVVTQERGGRTEGGQPYAADSYRQRSASADILVTRDELRDLMDRLDWRKGMSSPFYVALEQDLDLEYQQMSSFWAVLERSGEARPLPMARSTSTPGAHLFRKRYDFLERL